MNNNWKKHPENDRTTKGLDTSKEPMDTTQRIDLTSVVQKERRNENSQVSPDAPYQPDQSFYQEDRYGDSGKSLEQDSFAQDYQGSSPYYGPNPYQQTPHPSQNNYRGNHDAYRYEPYPSYEEQFGQINVVSKRAFNFFDFFAILGGLLMILLPIVGYVSFPGDGYFISVGPFSLIELVDMLELMEGPSGETQMFRLLCYGTMALGGIIVLFALLRLRWLNIVFSTISAILLAAFFFYLTAVTGVELPQLDFYLGYYLTIITAVILLLSPPIALALAKSKHEKSKHRY